MATAATVLVKTCSKCNTAPAEKGDSWCKDCRNKYQQEYRKNADWRAERKGIVRGVLAMREHSANFFQQWAGRPFMGAEAAAAIRSLIGPPIAPEDARPKD